MSRHAEIIAACLNELHHKREEKKRERVGEGREGDEKSYHLTLLPSSFLSRADIKRGKERKGKGWRKFKFSIILLKVREEVVGNWTSVGASGNVCNVIIPFSRKHRQHENFHAFCVCEGVKNNTWNLLKYLWDLTRFATSKNKRTKLS